MKKEFDKWYEGLSDKNKGRISFHHYSAELSIVFVRTKENTKTELTTQLRKYLKPFNKRILVGVMKSNKDADRRGSDIVSLMVKQA